jgi:lycopene cyclase domain-containing protein
MRHLTYLALLLGCAGLTIPLEFALRTQVLTRLRTLLLAITPAFVVFVSWDGYAISHHQWWYDLSWMTGVLLPDGVPLEEALFFVVVPAAAVLTYEGVRNYQPRLAEPDIAEPDLAPEPAAASERSGGWAP